ncbi:MAG: nucleotide 5'-monophosphate nucleosidase PpnN [Pontibacterium sp.]
MHNETFVTTSVTPVDHLDTLSPHEVALLHNASQGGLYHLFRQCSLAVLNCGSEMDSTEAVLEKFKDFDVHISHKHRSVQLDLINAPASAFVDGELIVGIREHLFSVLRDLLYVSEGTNILHDSLVGGDAITHQVFNILRHAQAFKPHEKPNLVVCWGGHSIGRTEYEYTKKVGYELGLRGVNICTGCGPGAMKGPMKGATIAHAKQRIGNGRYVGITEPGIIAAESPNPIVDELIIMPDIEKRLEAFVRLGHGIIVFPGGAGTAEEIFYALGVMLHERNSHVPFPLIMTGPKESADYFETIDRFIRDTLGEEVTSLYEIIVDDPPAVARRMKEKLEGVTKFRKATDESFHFNWQLHVPEAFQAPFEPTHQTMAQLNLDKTLSPFELAVNLRCALSGIVAGNVKSQGVAQIKKHGPFLINGDPALAESLDSLLRDFIAQRRMKINYRAYEPCFKITPKSNKSAGE